MSGVFTLNTLKICLVVITIVVVITTGLFVYKFISGNLDSSDYPHTVLLVVSAFLITRAIAQKEALDKKDNENKTDNTTSQKEEEKVNE